MKNIVIFGSCVSRDAFELTEKDDYAIIGYFARSSLASLMSPPCIDKNILGNIDSRFQKKW